MYTGSGGAKLKLSFVDRFTVEKRQLAGFIIVSAKSSMPLYTRKGNKKLDFVNHDGIFPTT